MVDTEELLINKVISFKDLKQYNFCIRLLEKLFNITNNIIYIKCIAYMYYLSNEKKKAIETMVFYYELADGELRNI